MKGFFAALVTRKAVSVVVRYGLTAIGGALVAQGYVDADTLAGFAWSVCDGAGTI